MKKLILIITIGVFLLLAGEMSFAQRVDSVIVTTVNTTVVVKDMPGVRGKFAFEVPGRSVIVVYAKTIKKFGTVGYYEISYFNQTGYVYSRYLVDALSREGREAIKSISHNITTYETNKDAFYQKVTSQQAGRHPGQSYSTISYLTPGDELLKYNKLKNVSYTMYGSSICLGIIVAAAGSEMEQNTIVGISVDVVPNLVEI